MIIKRFWDKKEIAKVKETLNILYGCKPKSKFAWLPVELTNQDFVWLGFYIELEYTLQPYKIQEILWRLSTTNLNSDDYDHINSILQNCRLQNYEEFDILYHIHKQHYPYDKVEYKYIPNSKAYGDKYIEELFTHNNYGLVIDKLIMYYTTMLFNMMRMK